MFAWQATVQDEFGNAVLLPVVTVYENDGVTLAAIYAEDEVTPLDNPLTGTMEGFVQFWADRGNYEIEGASGGSITETWSVSLGDWIQPFANRAASVAATVPPSVDRIGVFAPNGDTLWYKRDAAGTALTTGGGAKWSPDGVATPQHFGAVGGGGADDTEALQRSATYCATNGKEIYLPAGTYTLTDKITVTKTLSIRGDGPKRTRLLWPSDATTVGFRVAPSSGVDQTKVEGVAFETGKAGEGTALEIDYSAFPVIDPSGAWRNGQPLMASVENFLIRGRTNFSTDGFAIGIDAISIIGMNIRDGKIQGLIDTADTLPISDAGILFRGDGSPIQLVVHGVMMSGVQDGIRCEETEGIYISACEFVTVGTGFRSENMVGETGFWFMGSHTNSIGPAVVVSRIGDGFIKDNLFFATRNVPTLSFIEIKDNASNICIEGNQFRRTGGSSTVVTSVDVQGGSNNRIGKNYHAAGSSNTAVKVAVGATRTNIETQDFSMKAVAPYVDASATTIYGFYPEYGGDLDDIYLPPEGAEQTHTLTTGVTNAPSDWPGTAGAIVVTRSFSSTISVQTAWQPNISAVGNNMYQRRKSTSWQPWYKFVGGAV